MSINKAILVGNLGKDPEVKQTGTGRTMVTFTLATSNKFKDKQGVQQERTDWHNIVAWGKTGELMQSMLKKGSEVLIKGKVTSRKYEDKDGQTRYLTEIVANEFLSFSKKEMPF